MNRILGSTVGRVLPVLFILAALAAVIALALGASAGRSPGSAGTNVSAQQAAAARQMAANQAWASATCSSVVSWKSEIQRDLHGLTLSLGAITQVQAAIGATSRMVDSIEKSPLPPALQGAQARAEIAQLRADVQSQMHAIESAASGVAAGNFTAIGTLLNTVGNVPTTARRILTQVRDVASELGVSLAASPSCRQLVGIKL